MEHKHTTCRLCPLACPIVVHLENGRITSAERTAKQSIEQGYYCQKLAAAKDIVYSSERVKTPLVKKESRGAITWQEATWNHALDA